MRWSRSLSCSLWLGIPSSGAAWARPALCPLTSVGYRMTALQNSHPILKLYFSANKQKQHCLSS